MKKLTIGELSALLGIPPSTMRFYESRAIVSPEKNHANQYRAYSSEESCRFLVVKRLQSLGFSLAEARGLIDAPDGGGFVPALALRRTAIEGEIARLRMAADSLSSLAGDWEQAQADKEGFVESSMGPRLYLFTREAGAYRREAGRRKLARLWMEGLPRLAYVCQIQGEGFLGAEAPICRWGFSLPLEESTGGEGAYVEAQDGCKTLTTGLERRISTDFVDEELRQARKAFLATGREIAGPPTATFLGIKGGRRNPMYLYRLDIPVKQ